jgi:excisionase family DNA binding protein
MSKPIRQFETPKTDRMLDELTAGVTINAIEGMQSKIFYTIKDACQMLSLSRATISGAIQKGKLKHYKYGRRKLLTMQHMLDYKDLIARGEAR